MTDSATDTPQLRTEAVVRFLEQNPDFLIRHGFTSPTQKARVINLGQTLIQRAGKVIRDFNSTRDALADIHDANAENMERVHHAGYLLMAANDAGEVVSIIHDHFPAILGVGAARLLVPSGSALIASGGVGIAPKTIEALTGKSGIDMGAPDSTQSKIFEGIAPCESAAFAALPEVVPGVKSAGTLALAGASAKSFRPDDASDLLTFTVTMIAIALIARGQK